VAKAKKISLARELREKGKTEEHELSKEVSTLFYNEYCPISVHKCPVVF
jgi:hypothetical protein